MHYSQMEHAKIAVGLKGAEAIVYGLDSKKILVVGLTPGIHFAKKILEVMEPGETVEIKGDAFTISQNPNRTRRAVHQMRESEDGTPRSLHTESGANPDFRPQKITEAEARMRKMVTEVNARNDAIERRMNQLKTLETKKAKAKPEEKPEEKPETKPELDAQGNPLPSPEVVEKPAETPPAPAEA